jgi:hypothetical protein
MWELLLMLAGITIYINQRIPPIDQLLLFIEKGQNIYDS